MIIILYIKLCFASRSEAQHVQRKTTSTTNKDSIEA